jgi:hypothetical protein
MLFMHPAGRGQGGGRRLLTHAINNLGATDLDVNEQNEQAVEFYLHLGCAVIDRSERDGMGMPYPLQHVRLPARLCYTNTMDFEWDDQKAEYNLQKHGVSFPEASTAFYDPLVITFADPDHSADEDRFIVIGLSAAGRLLMVAHTDRGNRIRIISARTLKPKERRLYESGQ